MTKTIAIAQARVGSTRLPGKVMFDLGGKPVLRWTWDALRESPGVDIAVIATSTLPADDVIADYCKASLIPCFRGSESDVLDRFYQCALKYKADVVLRITCDCPFIDPQVTGQVIQLRDMTDTAYCSNQPFFPDGLDVECFTFEALRAAWLEAVRPSDRDTVTQFIIRNRDRFPAESVVCPFPGMFKERWVLDTKADFELCKAIASRWNRLYPPSCTDILRILNAEPALRGLNRGAIRNERFYEGLSEERLPAREFTRSDAHFARATQTIPFGSQTFSKSHVYFPQGAAPLYVSHGDGCRVFDVDGHDYIDLISALLPVVLGYRDCDVDYAVRRQLSTAGMSFSLATKLEAELSEKLSDLIPCAEMVKLGKSGTDVTTAAVRAARAYTGRDHVMVGGYHGWADWSMAGTTNNEGIPNQVAELTSRFAYGDRAAVEYRASNDTAAIVVEPTENPTFLSWLRQFCIDNGIVLIFDEIRTGFRYSMGGAQKYFDVTPDLACFGKSMGNGMPISALVGRSEIMKVFEPPNGIFYSGTFFGDTLSIAAALATIEKMENEEVIEHLWTTGLQIWDAVDGFLIHYGLHGNVWFSGYAPMKQINFKDHKNATAKQLQSLFTQEMAQKGVLVLNANCISFAHKKPEVRKIIQAYGHTLLTIKACLDEAGLIDKFLKGTVTASPLRATA